MAPQSAAAASAESTTTETADVAGLKSRRWVAAETTAQIAATPTVVATTQGRGIPPWPNVTIARTAIQASPNRRAPKAIFRKVSSRSPT